MNLNSIFSDHMILQANKPVRVFGLGAGSVTVELADKTAAITATGSNWLVELPAFDYGGPYEMTVTLNGEVKQFTDIWFGDVYLLSGQSNNQFKLWQSNTPKEYYADNDSLRLFTVDRLEDEGKHVWTAEGWKSFRKDGTPGCFDGEHYEAKDGWIPAQADLVQFWPALGYLFGIELLKTSDRKIGLIACYQGASVIQSWIPAHHLEGTELDIPFALRSDSFKNPEYIWNGDGILYEGMLKTILPIPMKAVVWYQGEANTTGADSSHHIYAGMLTSLIDKWRLDFQDDRLPFIVIQIHDYIHGLNRKNGDWRAVQAAQEAVCNTVAHTHLVKSNDVCETDDIHPKSKLALSLRIADTIKNFL